MRITPEQLKQIIKEEMTKEAAEDSEFPEVGASFGPDEPSLNKLRAILRDHPGRGEWNIEHARRRGSVEQAIHPDATDVFRNEIWKLVKDEDQKDTSRSSRPSSEETAFVVGYFGYGDTSCYLHSIHTSEQSANKAYRELKKLGKEEGHYTQAYFVREVPLNPGAIVLHGMVEV